MSAFNKPTNPPAFPLHNHGAQTLGLHVTGMTLRDYMAAKAMQALLRKYPDHLMNSPADAVACDAYILADAMLKAREA
jgi:hypothetical protein